MRNRVFTVMKGLVFLTFLTLAGCDLSAIGEEIGETVREDVKGTIVNVGATVLEAWVEATWD